jgi:hypothetical protein
MADVISLPFRAKRLPRRLLNDGWWLTPHPAHPPAEIAPFPVHGRRLCNVIPFPIAHRQRKACDE